MGNLTCSVVLPIHNEAPYLRYSLFTLRNVAREINEFVFVLDRCTDDSEHLVRSVFPHAKIFLKHEQVWSNPTAEAFQYGYDRAEGDIIFALGADLIVDPQMFTLAKKLFQKHKDLGTVSFRYYNYSLFESTLRRIHEEYENFYRTMLEKFRPETETRIYFTGTYAFSKRMMEEIGGLKDFPSEYDEFIRRVIHHPKWKHFYIRTTRILHLRAGLSKKKQLLQGKARFHLPHYTLWRIVLNSIIHFTPYRIVGYLHERRVNA